MLLEGVQVLGFQFRDFAIHAAAEAERNDAELMDLLAAGRVTPHIGATFGLDGTAAALRHVADGRAVGKVVIDIDIDIDIAGAGSGSGSGSGSGIH